MRASSALVVLAVLLTPHVAAEPLHHSAVCITYAGHDKVYHASATQQACKAYQSQDEPRCDDCSMMEIKHLNLCHSGKYLIGGKEMTNYCKQFGAHDSVRNSY